jgi:hypothetical protein
LADHKYISSGGKMSMAGVTNPFLNLLSNVTRELDHHSDIIEQGQHVNALLSQLALDPPNLRVARFIQLYQLQFFNIVQTWTQHQFNRNDLLQAQIIIYTLLLLVQNEPITDDMATQLWPWSDSTAKKWLLAESRHGKLDPVSESSKSD